jgi:hypothetical protein
MGQYILDCNGERDAANPVCTLNPYHPPPATVEHYTLAPVWSIFVVAAVILVAIVAAAIVAYKRIEDGDTRGNRRLQARKAELEARARIAEAHKVCSTCGDVYDPTLEDLKT